MHNTDLILLIYVYRKERNDYNFNKILYKLSPLIKRYLKKIPNEDKEDIRQELLAIVYEKVINANITYTYLSKSLFTTKNLRLLKKENYSLESFIKHFKNKYVYYFINKYGVSNFEETFSNKNTRRKFINDFAIEGAKNKFYKLLKISFNSVIVNYYREKEIWSNILSLNNTNEINVEYINIIYQKDNNHEINWKIFDIQDKEFLFKCFNDKRVLTQLEIAKELNITQQAVSKRFKKIREKYKEKIKN